MKCPSKKFLSNFLLFFLILFPNSFAQIRIVLSAALTEQFFEYRKKQYIEALTILAQLGHPDVYVIEALRYPGPTFLDDYSKNVFYSTVNDVNIKNIGINEARTLLQGSYYFNFTPEDMIIKITGRYQLISDHFIKLVQNNPEVDAFVHFEPNGNIYTLAFAIKCKYFQEMYSTMDYTYMEKNRICVETEVANYIRRKIKEGNFKCCRVDRFDITANCRHSSAGNFRDTDHDSIRIW